MTNCANIGSTKVRTGAEIFETWQTPIDSHGANCGWRRCKSDETKHPLSYGFEMPGIGAPVLRMRATVGDVHGMPMRERVFLSDPKRCFAMVYKIRTRSFRDWHRSCSNILRREPITGLRSVGEALRSPVFSLCRGFVFVTRHAVCIISHVRSSAAVCRGSPWILSPLAGPVLPTSMPMPR